jgi:hypothetical protein
MWKKKDKEGWLPSCVEFGMLVLYLNDLKDTSSKFNIKGQRQAQKQGDLKNIKFIVKLMSS